MHLVVGTSGHIDHGKTTLIRALTGVDTDRLEEEKARGITIDIGFAHWEDAQGNQISFVDVPGHERFVHNMLAGAVGMDAVLMVIAGDEGVMPQTREHLHICDLLGIKNGVIALTRRDLVDDELLELCAEDVREATAGTFLAEAPIVPVSGITGEGLDELKAHLSDLAKAPQEHRLDLPFRFPVDRSFTLKGFGTVVTGTIIAGQLSKETPLLQFPQQRAVRLRGLQVHGQPADSAMAGQRAALNLTGIAKDEIQRGHQLAAPDSLLTGYLLNVELRLLHDAPRDLTQRTRVRLHLGTQEVMGRILLLGEEAFKPGETQFIQLRLEQQVSARYGDRFIIRNYSPVYTLGGGRVLDPAPSKSRRMRRQLAGRLVALAGEDEHELVEEAIALQGTRGIPTGEATVRTGLSEAQFTRVARQLSSQGKIFQLDPDSRRFVHQQTVERVGRFLKRVLGDFHQSHPEREGMTRAELSGKLSLIFSEKEVSRLLQRLVRDGQMALEGQFHHLPTHEKRVSGQAGQLMERLIETLRSGGYQPLRKTLLLDACGVDAKTGLNALNLAAHENRLTRVKEDLYYLPEVIAEIRNKLEGYLVEKGEITVIDFKDLTGVSRKHAVDLLEHFDSERLTLRLDNFRVLRQPPPPTP